MRNLKKILALVLAMVMTFSVMATANAFSDDAKIDDTYNEAVEVLAALEVFEGYEDGSFQPKGLITRAEVAAIIYRIVTGDVDNNQVSIYADYNKFTDVKSTAWYAGYVNFCANAEYIKGYGDGKFGPNDQVTGYQALAMILRAIGYDKNGEFTGANWQVQTAAVGKKLGITDNVTAGTLGTAATREVVAEILFQTILVPQASYTLAFGYTTYGNDSLGYETFKLVGTIRDNDYWGRPATVWMIDKNNDKVATAADTKLVYLWDEAVVEYNTYATECDVATATAQTAREVVYTTYTNGMQNAGKQIVNSLDTTGIMGTAQGRMTYVYKDRIVYIDTLLAQVTDVTAVKYDAAGHVRTYATLKLDVYDSNNHATTVTLSSKTNYSYAIGDMLLVNAGQNQSSVINNTAAHIEILGKADSITGAQTLIWNNYAKHTVNGTDYNDNNRFHMGVDTKSTANRVWYFDQFNNLIGTAEIAGTYTYGVINSIYWVNTNGVGTAYATLVNMDATVSEPVVVAKINGYIPTYALAGTAGQVSGNYIGISTYAADNAANAILNNNDLFKVTTYADGSIALDEVTTELVNATIESKYAVIAGTKSGKGESPVNTNSNTQYLVYNTTTKTYEAITGFNNIYDFTASARIDYVHTNNDSFADYVYVYGTPDKTSGNSLVLVQSAAYTENLKGSNAKYTVRVAMVDGNVTTIDTDELSVVTALTDKTAINKLFYVSYVGEKAVKVAEVTESPMVINKAGDRAVKLNVAKLNGDVMFGEITGGTVAYFNVTTANKIVGDLSDLADTYVYLIYTSKNTSNYAQEIYVLDNAHDATDSTVPATKGVIEYTVTIVNEYMQPENTLKFVGNPVTAGTVTLGNADVNWVLGQLGLVTANYNVISYPASVNVVAGTTATAAIVIQPAK